MADIDMMIAKAKDKLGSPDIEINKYGISTVVSRVIQMFNDQNVEFIENNDTTEEAFMANLVKVPPEITEMLLVDLLVAIIKVDASTLITNFNDFYSVADIEPLRQIGNAETTQVLTRRLTMLDRLFGNK